MFFSAGSKTMSSLLIQGMTIIEVRGKERRPLPFSTGLVDPKLADNNSQCAQ